MKEIFNQIRRGFMYATGFFLFNCWVGIVLGVVSTCASRGRVANAAELNSSQFSNTTTHQFFLGDDRVAMGLARYKIVLVDTGFDPKRATARVKICPTEHYDYFTKTGNINFSGDHGTVVASIIAEKLKDVDYCIVFLQINEGTGKDIASSVLEDAYYRIAAINPVAINQSISCTNCGNPEVLFALRQIEENHSLMFMSAGNNGLDLDKSCQTFPPCYNLSNKVVVGALDPDDPKKHWYRSNKGKVIDAWAPSYAINKDGETYYGTSFAAPRALAEYILFLEHKRLAAQKSK